MSDAGRDPFSRLLYPMLSEQPPVAGSVLDALAAAPVEKSSEGNRLRLRLCEEYEEAILDCAAALAARLRRGGRVLACGNGGSATSAADLVGSLLTPTPPHRPLAALGLSSDVAVVTAVANDVSFDDVYTRQIIALGHSDDALVAISTSGNSENLVRALVEARRRGMLAVALTGYDGGRMARDARPDFAFVVRSSSVHRIQEVQTTLYHVLVELVQREVEVTTCA